MGKHEAPPFKMVIDAGKLIPATAYDAERLDTYRRGTRVSVSFVRDGGRVMERKWWAILGRAVKECKTPWENKEQASEAIKLSLGIVNLSKTVNGHFMQYPKSLTELEDPELDEAVMRMMEIIQHITGVDPDEWRKQIGDLGQDDEQNTEPSAETPTSADAGSDNDPMRVAPDLPADEADQPGDVLDPPSEVSSGSTSLSVGDRFNLRDLIVRLKAAVGVDPDVVKMTRNSFAAEGRPLGDLAKAKAETIVGYFKDACGYTKEEDARKALAKAIALSCGVAQIDEFELRGR